MLKAFSIGLVAASVWVCDGLRQTPRATGWVRDGVRLGVSDSVSNGGGDVLPPDYLTGLLVRYRLDDSAEGTVVASDIPGVPSAVSTVPTSGISVPGQIGTAFDFSTAGFGAFLEDASEWLPMGQSARTVSCWMRWSGDDFDFAYVWGFPGDQVLYEHHLFYLHAVHGSAGVTLNLSGFFYDLDVTAAICDTSWHMVACTYDGASVARLYVDGVEVGSAFDWYDLFTRAGSGTYDGRLQLGQDFGDSYNHPWPGAVDDFRVYSSCLGVEEIASIVLAGGGTVGSSSPPLDVSVYFDATGGDLGESPSSVEVTVGGIYGDLPVPYLDGYSFSGWYSYDMGVTVDYYTEVILSSDHTLYAQWTTP